MCVTEASEESSYQYLFHRQDEVMNAFREGEIEDIQVSQKMPVDQLISFGLREGFLKPGLQSFPDPRQTFEVPIDVVLVSQILQRLNDEHSLISAPYALNSAELVSELGYNIEILEQGFNNRATFPRETIFHGEVLKHILLASKPESLINWYNRDWLNILRENSPGRTRQYILDGTKIYVPESSWTEYQGAGKVKNQDGTYSYGYKIVWLQEILDKKGVIVSLKIGPIETHDLELGKQLVAEFQFESGSSLLMDRGFIDGEWMKNLKNVRGIDLFIPMKRNMDITVNAIALADLKGEWGPHPTRKEQKIAEIPEENLCWDECPVFKSGVIVRFQKKTGEITEILFVTTHENRKAKFILLTYDQRAEIEESHRQMKCFQGMGKLVSKKLVRTVFQILMTLIGYNTAPIHMDIK
jgi:hypothetical protein